MFISKIGLQNFRGFGNNRIEIPFSKGINTLIGENNTGKTSIIDAIRICFSLGKYRKDIYFSLSDFHVNRFGIRANEAVIDFYFDELKPYAMDIVDLMDITKGELHVRFYTIKDNKGNEKIRNLIWGGRDKDNLISSELFEQIQFSYLPALRDSERELKPNRTSLLSSLLESTSKVPSEKEELLEVLLNANRELGKKEPIKRIQQIINSNLTSIEQEILNQRISIGLTEPNLETIGQSLFSLIQANHITVHYGSDEYNSLVETIKPEVWNQIIEKSEEIISIDLAKFSRIDNVNYLLLLEKEVFSERNVFQVSQNGLGLNNILYMASALGDIANQSEYDMKIILIEEPEAHLHPQLQNIIYEFFQQTEESVQILFTTHSPTLTSKVELSNTNLLVNKGGGLDNIPLSRTVLFSKDKDGLANREKEKKEIQKFLDVTKSQLFFGKGVIFVEGICEALLLPIFSSIIELNLVKYGVEVVNLNGVSFQSFVDLLCLDQDRKKVTLPISLITDDDKCSDPDESDYISEDFDFDTPDISSVIDKLRKGKHSGRVRKLETVCQDTHIGFFPSEKTFEFNLVNNSSNQGLFLSAIQRVLPTVGNRLIDEFKKDYDVFEKATRLWLCLKKRDKYKSDISMALSQLLEEDSRSFVVPENFMNAIRYVTNGPL